MQFRRSTGRLFWGLILCALGVVWLLENIGVTTVSLGDLIRLYWPAIPIYFGVVGFTEALTRGFGENRGLLWGSLIVNAFFTAFFVVILGNINFWWSIDLDLIWKVLLPVLLLFIGVSLLRGGVQRPGARTYWSVMSGTKAVNTAWEDISAIAVMGGGDVDFSQAGLPDREYIIDVYCLMGGFDFKVPEGVRVECDWTGIMGGVTVNGKGRGALVESQRISAGEGPVVRLRAVTIMGGAGVKTVPATRPFEAVS